jgi:hypothetical protein
MCIVYYHSKSRPQLRPEVDHERWDSFIAGEETQTSMIGPLIPPAVTVPAVKVRILPKEFQALNGRGKLAFDVIRALRRVQNFTAIVPRATIIFQRHYRLLEDFRKTENQASIRCSASAWSMWASLEFNTLAVWQTRMLRNSKFDRFR